ncbi:MAG: hypothetical protein M1G31_05665 [Pseudanabaena sp. Salubria-1]|nr:hypothetical protein [Pseudanabaena sp. Salubria-1]
MKLILEISTPKALKSLKSVLRQVRQRRTCLKTDFYNENYWIAAWLFSQPVAIG